MDDSFRIRPAGRIIFTIGEDLIQDGYAALVELVKNAYDADSPDVIITFSGKKEDNYFEISVKDRGHGMSRDDVLSKWLVPATDYKSKKRISPGGRIMQGSKGIGRYAASILGEDLFLETVTEDGEKTELYLDWNKFRTNGFLDQIEVLVESSKTDQPKGTTLTIHFAAERISEWNYDALDKLRYELKKLVPPIAENIYNDPFKIFLCFNGLFMEHQPLEEEITPYPILDLFDYRISGVIEKDGKGILEYECQKANGKEKSNISVEYGETGCGKLIMDIRVYDRDPESVDELIQRGLRNESTQKYVSKLDARRLLNDVNGIGVYRNGFRIRPLGDADFDWLKLNEQRVQNPTMRIGSNQVVGYVHIESENISHLVEKSARDGLKNNDAYIGLKYITGRAIMELQGRRYNFRRKMGLIEKRGKINDELKKLYDYDNLKKDIAVRLRKASLAEEVIGEIVNIISDEQASKNNAVDEIRRMIAIYQGQATLGKIINVILHECRRPLNYFKNQIPNLEYYSGKFISDHSEMNLNKILHFTSGIAENADIFVAFFGKLDPLSAKQIASMVDFSIIGVISDVISVFENELNANGIEVSINSPDKIYFHGWKQDFYTIFTNLIDNSIYWIKVQDSETKEIRIDVSKEDDELQIDYIDSGPGIDLKFLESGVIFEPEFSTKLGGTGLGLAIAGEAASRNGLALIALQNDGGAYFRLSTKKEM